MGLLDFLSDEYGQAKKSFGLLGEVLSGAKRNPDNLKTLESIKGLLGATPGFGDAIAANDAVDYAKSGQYGMSALAGLGALPLVPNMVGTVGKFGKYKPLSEYGGIFPDIQNITRVPNKSIVRSSDDAYLRLSTLPEGNFQADYIPPWGSKSKEFSVIGDDAEELHKASLARINRSDKAIERASVKKFNDSLLGKLQSEYGDVFSLDRSTQSKSEYITHNPSGTKIRISDHNLPLHYDQPDVDLRIGMSVEDKLAEIKKYLGQ